MEQKELNEILDKHRRWIVDGFRGYDRTKMKADLSGASLHGADLRGVELRYADLGGANLRNAILNGANLGDARLARADLSDADLLAVNLIKTDMYGAVLRGANLRGADLRKADLRWADLRGADLGGANLQGAYLQNAIINEETILSFPLACPEEGAFIGWKKAGGKIIKLAIPVDAKRLSATSRKCRCDKAKVLAIEELDGENSGLEDIRSSYDKKFIYRLGKTAKVKNFCEDRWQECSEGIHFFITREEAVRYE